MSSLLSRLGGSSSRRSSVSDDPNRPTTSEIKTSPAPGCGPKKKTVYSKEQEDKIEELRQYAFTLLLPESDPYHPWEKRFLSDPGCMPRYCRAAKWKMDNAKERIRGTVEWRREFKPDLIKPDHVKIEAETGKIIVNGFDFDGRPIIYMRPGRENTQKSPRQIEHLIFHLERAIDLAPPGAETVTIVVDYASATSQSNPSIGTARQALNILQNHYVERMGKAIVVNMPWWVNAFFQGIQPFMDPVTKEKIRFNPNMTEIVPKEQLDTEFGGDNNYKFDHDIYWRTLVQDCYLAPDGGRLDKDGKPTVAPLGNGAKAAALGLEAAGGMPEMQHEQAETRPGMSPAMVDENQRSSYLAGAGAGAGAGVAAVAAGAAAVGSSANSEKPPVTGPDGDAQLNTKMENLRTSSIKQESQTPRRSLDSVRSAASVEVETAPGPPAGPVVFDHPPTEEEKMEAKRLMEKEEAAVSRAS